MTTDNSSTVSIDKKRFGCLQVFGLIVIAIIITAGVTILVFKTCYFTSEFKPVTLTPQEEQVLTMKLEKLDSMGAAVTIPGSGVLCKPLRSDQSKRGAALEPEPYSEENTKREINFTEKELNALLAKNTDLANRLAFDLSENLISAKLLLPVDEDFPVLGGKIIRLRSGMELRYGKGRPVVILKGITFMGVPVPNAWMGGIKNIDLVERFEPEKGFWKTFSDGVEDIKIEEGVLKIRLKE